MSDFCALLKSSPLINCSVRFSNNKNLPVAFQKDISGNKSEVQQFLREAVAHFRANPIRPVTGPSSVAVAVASPGVTFPHWSVEQVCEHFARLGANAQVVSKIRKEQVDGNVLKDIPSEELEKLGVPFGVRAKHGELIGLKSKIAGPPNAGGNDNNAPGLERSGFFLNSPVRIVNVEPLLVNAKFLGRGAFGEVFAVKLDGTEAVVKRLLPGALAEEVI